MDPEAVAQVCGQSGFWYDEGTDSKFRQSLVVRNHRTP